MPFLNLKQGTKVIYNEKQKGWRNEVYEAEIVSVPYNDGGFPIAIIQHTDKTGKVITRRARIVNLQLKRE